MIAADPGRPVTELLLAVGRSLSHPRDARGYLIVEALVGARRDDDMAEQMRCYIGERADRLADLIRIAQAGAELDPALSPGALAHFCLLLAMGSALITPDLHAVGEQEWAALLARVVTGLAPADITAQTDRSNAVRVQISSQLCQGHGRCYDLAPALFGDDDDGYGTVLGDGVVPPEQGPDARRAVLNCPEHAIQLLEEEA
jgi:ferredoxin